MKKRAIIFVLLFTVYSSLFTTNSYAQKWTWSNLVSTADQDITNTSITTDASGNVYMVGVLDEAPVFPNPITPTGSITSSQAFLTKVNASGTYEWMSIMQGAYTVNEYAFMFSNGNIGVVGAGQFPLLFNGLTYTPRTNYDAYQMDYFALYSSSGNELSLVKMESVNLIASDQIGDNVYVTMIVKDTLWYNNDFIAMPTGHQYGLFRVKFDSNGSIQEILRLGTGSYSYAVGRDIYSVKVTSEGETFVSYNADAADPGNGVTVPASGNAYSKLITTKFDANGTALWATYASSTISDGASAAVGSLDKENNLYLATGFQNNITLGGQTYTTVTTNTWDQMVIKITPQGDIAWVDHFNNTSQNTSGLQGTAAIAYEKGFLYLTGTMSGYVNFGTFYYQNTDVTGFTLSGDNKMFYLLKMDTTGSVSRFRIFGNAEPENFVLAMNVQEDEVYVGGRVMNDNYFDNTPLMDLVSPNTNTDYKYNMYLARFDDCNAQITKSGTTLTATAGTSYQWNVNGSAISGATAQTYDVGSDVSDKYTVDVTFAGGCVSRSAVLPLGSITTSIISSDANANILSLYPNPATNQLTVSLRQPADGSEVQVQVFNSKGEPVWNDQFVNNQNQTTYQMNVQNLSQGIYYLTLSKGADTFGSTFIKQ